MLVEKVRLVMHHRRVGKRAKQRRGENGVKLGWARVKSSTTTMSATRRLDQSPTTNKMLAERKEQGIDKGLKPLSNLTYFAPSAH